MCIFSIDERTTYFYNSAVRIHYMRVSSNGGRIIGETDGDGDATDDLDPEPQLVVIEPLPRICLLYTSDAADE